ncbi:MAG: hypothetical protein DWH79_06935 [Planctomycetota bacterium]|nr:MAG: hypothetical protein DWH79_06935 [Planctomycetota bacterium]
MVAFNNQNVAVKGKTLTVASPATRATRTWAARLPDTTSCLVASGNATLLQRLDAAADLAGWSECDAAVDVDSLRGAVSGDHQLVVVDLASPLDGDAKAVVAVAEVLSQQPGTLLVVCGADGCPDHERWARSIGAFLYLPGVTRGDDLVSLFAEARRVAGRWSSLPRQWNKSRKAAC